ncbi:MAG: hypothetical protein ACXVRZ_11475 [Gaiellaceae bacterium]|jgi:hypothetical protein
MADYTILLDGERVASIDSDSAVRAWIARYREDHADDDPAAAHVQILERGAFAWLTGGKLIDRERFL